ncbi:MAG TPA: T9SS type A sorting domain-containing protein, partial [Bacteroidia bacterium]|nr:T9SS type A sorting domain-containing protein [Bacteroidia bacterium]
PADGSFYVRPAHAIDLLEVTDMTGRIVFAGKDYPAGTPAEITGLADGMYIVRAFSGGVISTQKVSVKSR